MDSVILHQPHDGTGQSDLSGKGRYLPLLERRQRLCAHGPPLPAASDAPPTPHTVTQPPLQSSVWFHPLVSIASRASGSVPLPSPYWAIQRPLAPFLALEVELGLSAVRPKEILCVAVGFFPTSCHRAWDLAESTAHMAVIPWLSASDTSAFVIPNTVGTVEGSKCQSNSQPWPTCFLFITNT